MQQATETTTSSQQTSNSAAQHDDIILAAVGEARKTAAEAQQNTEQLLNKLKQVFADEQTEQDDWYKEILSAALEAEKQGYPIPLTLKISTELKKTQEENKKLLKIIEELKQKAEMAADPESYADMQAYTTIDALIDRHLQQAYRGQAPEQVKTAIIQDLKQRILWDKQNNPESWRKVRQDPHLLDKVVRASIANFVPTIAKEALDEYVGEREEYDAETIFEAIKEAQALLKNKEIAKDPEKVKLIHDKIKRLREMYWEAKMSWSGGKTRI